MDVVKFKLSLEGLMSQLFVLDVNGAPTTQPMPARAQAPASLTESDLPTWIFFTGQGTYQVPPDQTNARLKLETRDFQICLYAIITQTGIDGEAERRVEPYLDYSRNHIESNIQLWDGNVLHRVPGIQRGFIVRDEGVTVLRYGVADKPLYLGLRFTVRVECKNEVIYATNQ